MKHYIFKAIAILFILTITFPPFIIGVSVRAGMVLVASLFLFPKLLTKGSFIALLVYTFEMFLYYLLGNRYFESVNSVISPFAVIGSSIILTEYIIQYDKENSFSRLSILVIIIVDLLMSLISIPILNNDPNIIRNIYSEGMRGVGRSLLYMFIISWGTISSLPFLFAPMVNICKKTYKTKKSTFLFWFISIIILFFIIFRSNITTPFIVSIIMIIIGCIIGFERFTKKNIVKTIFLGFFAISLTSPVIVIPVLNFFQENMVGGDTSGKLDEIKDAVVYGDVDGDLGSRNDLFNQSLSLFFDSPFTGTSNPEKIGQHSFFIDRLACHGVLFIIPLIILFVVMIRRIYRNLTHSKVIYVFATGSFLFMLLFKSDAYMEIWLSR